MFNLIHPQEQRQNTIKFLKNGSKQSIKTQVLDLTEKKSLGRKLPTSQKERLIELITKQNYTMKEAAKIISISYSTAKKVFKEFRRNLRDQNQNKIYGEGSSIRSEYLQVCAQCAENDEIDMLERVIPEIPRIKIVSMVAGKQQTRTKNLILICGICGQQNKSQENIQ